MPVVPQTLEERKRAEEELRRKQGEVLAAYREVFGESEGKRSPAQQKVWEDLTVVGRMNQPVFVQDHAGALCPLKAAFADGRRSVFLYIRDCATRSLGSGK